MALRWLSRTHGAAKAGRKVVTKAEGKVDTTGGTVLIWFLLESLGFDIWFDSVWQIPATEPPNS